MKRRFGMFLALLLIACGDSSDQPGETTCEAPTCDGRTFCCANNQCMGCCNDTTCDLTCDGAGQPDPAAACEPIAEAICHSLVACSIIPPENRAECVDDERSRCERDFTPAAESGT